MNLFFNQNLARQYKSQSQKIRVLTENWVDTQVFCPSCGTNIENFENNKPVADFYCPKCCEEFELKGKKESVGNKVLDGAYRTMIERLKSTNNPNFFLLNYKPSNLEVINFFVIPKHFFIPEIIEKRKPLSKTARRAGWVGCNILLKNIPKIKRELKSSREKKAATIMANIPVETAKKILLISLKNFLPLLI